ncbi:MAG: aspartate kinase [Clostridiales bacterium]|jgi:aspartate kinase|nr:aspartate kinase [Clostridiales bacterium]
MADAAAINKAADIILSDRDRKYAVVSAPGKRNGRDEKVTDLLYAAQKAAADTGDCGSVFCKIEERFTGICADLELKLDITAELAKIKSDINGGADAHYAASRGEYLSAKIFAARLGFDFIDADKIVKFYADGTFDAEHTNDLAARELARHKYAVIPGFYGSLPSGVIRTFSRGGSDISGAIIARAARAALYENWTDVSGFMVCDPKIVANPQKIDSLTYKELRELSYMGAAVLHPESIFPVRKAEIPINIRNTFSPADAGTMIIPSKEYEHDEKRTITGIAGLKDFLSINIEKSMMNSEVGFARKVLSVLEHFNVSFEHMPSGIDTMSVIIDGSSVGERMLAGIIERLKAVVSPDNIEVVANLALSATVGHGMSRKKGTAARLFEALGAADINVRMIDQGSSELNIIVAVDNSDFEKTIKAIYGAFC